MGCRSRGFGGIVELEETGPDSGLRTVSVHSGRGVRPTCAGVRKERAVGGILGSYSTLGGVKVAGTSRE